MRVSASACSFHTLTLASGGLVARPARSTTAPLNFRACRAAQGSRSSRSAESEEIIEHGAVASLFALSANSPAAGKAAHGTRRGHRRARHRDFASLHWLLAKPLTAHAGVTDTRAVATSRHFTGCWQSRSRCTPASQMRAPSRLRATSPAAGRSTRRPAPGRGSPSRCTRRGRTRACRRGRCRRTACRRCRRPCRGSCSRCRGTRC